MGEPWGKTRLLWYQGALVFKALDLEMEKLKSSEEPKVDSRNVSAETFFQTPEPRAEMDYQMAMEELFRLGS